MVNLIIFERISILLFLSAFAFFYSCTGESESSERISSNDNTLDRVEPFNKNKEEIFHNEIPLINYTLDTIKSREHLNKILNKYRKTESNFIQHKVFITLNRKELRFLGVGSAYITPDTIVNDIKAYSVFPHYYQGAEKIPKLIVISNVYQAYGCYEYGKLVRFAAANTGKERTPSYPGRYALNWKVKLHRSSLDSNWVMPFTWNFHTEAGSAFHQFEMPGRPASHSCIRQFLDDAEWLFYWGEGIKRDSLGKLIPLSGTPVIIIDHYDFNVGKGKQWLRLKNNKEKVITLPENPMEVEEALIPIIQIPEMSRGSLRNRERYIYAEDTLRARGVIREGVKLIPSVNFNQLRREKAAKEAKLKRERELLQDKKDSIR
ncbi:MAG: L,D-transpeptidase [Candidatus Kapabacteria bacterium]|nr:L,D-transpeptidase [Candidatus Kapabacteria bacterium]